MPRVKGDGLRWESRSRKVYVGLNSHVFAVHVDLWRLAITFAHSDAVRARRVAAIKARKAALRGKNVS